MKYVVFQYAELYMPVIIPDHVTHSQISIEGATPISAGFFRENEGLTSTYGKSESLNLVPHERDCRLLDMTLSNYGTMHFLRDIVDN